MRSERGKAKGNIFDKHQLLPDNLKNLLRLIDFKVNYVLGNSEAQTRWREFERQEDIPDSEVKMALCNESRYSDLLLYTTWSNEERDLGGALRDPAICFRMHVRMDENPSTNEEGHWMTQIETVKERIKKSFYSR